MYGKERDEVVFRPFLLRKTFYFTINVNLLIIKISSFAVIILIKRASATANEIIRIDNAIGFLISHTNLFILSPPFEVIKKDFVNYDNKVFFILKVFQI